MASYRSNPTMIVRTGLRRFSAELPHRFRLSYPSKSVIIGLVFVLVLSAAGCGFRMLRKDLARAAEQSALEGRAEVDGASDSPIIVLVYSFGSQQVVDFFLLP